MVEHKLDHTQWEAPSFDHLLAPVLESPAELIKETSGKSVTRHFLAGRVFYVKNYFYGTHGFKSFKYFFKTPPSRAEWELAPRLKSLGIATVPHHAHGEYWRWRGLLKSTLITEGLSGFAPLQPAEVSPPIRAALGKFLRHLHDGGVFHADLHLSNLLYSSQTNEFCLVDLDNMKILTSISVEQRIENLATLHQRLPLSLDFYNNYDPDFSRFQERIAEHAERRYRASIPSKLKLLFHHRVAYAPKKIGPLKWYVRLSAWNKKLEPILKEPDEFLLQRSRLLKDGTSSTVGSAHGFVLKRSNLKKPQNLLFDLFRSARARRAFRLARHLELLRIDTPCPIAMAERRRLGFVIKSYFVMEEIPDAASLSTWAGDCLVAIERIAELIAKLHGEGFTHRDLRETNILFRPNGQPCLIDLDGLRYVKKTSARRAAADLARFMQGIKGELKTVPASHRLRFLKKYCATRELDDWRWWWHQIERNLLATKSSKMSFPSAMPLEKGKTFLPLPGDGQGFVHPDWQQTFEIVGLRSLEDFFSVSGTPLSKPALGKRYRAQIELKYGNETARVFLKRYQGESWRGFLQRRMEDGKKSAIALREVHVARALQEIGITTFVPLAWGWRGAWGPSQKSFVLMSRVPGESLEKWVPNNFADAHATWRKKIQLVEQLVVFARRLHDSGWFHRDFYLCHIFITESVGPINWRW